MDSDKCSRCGGEMLEPGTLYSAVRTSFRPQEAKFMTLQTGDVMTRATMCRTCGLIEITGDVTKLRRLTAEPELDTRPGSAFTAPTNGGREVNP